MAELLSLGCPSCGAEFAVPDMFRSHIEGRAMACPLCNQWWVGVPATQGPPVRLVDGKPERSNLDLRRYRRPAGTPSASAAAAGSDPGDASTMSTTTRVPVAADPSAPYTLRVVVKGPKTDLKGVFDLKGRSFLIGLKGCHLNLKHASIPERAIRVRESGGGFSLEGVGGFSIPMGPVSIVSGRIEAGGEVRIQLDPFELELSASTTPGKAISDLEKTASLASRQPAPAAPERVAPPQPEPIAAPPSHTEMPPAAAPPEAPPPMELEFDMPKTTTAPAQSAGARGRRIAGHQPGGDVRSMLQEVAVDVRPDQRPFGDENGQEPGLGDGEGTVLSLKAHGFEASRFGGVLEGMELTLTSTEGTTEGQVFRITRSPLLIGRTDGDLVIKDPRVSSKHAQLDVGGPRIYTLKDLASTNGTTLNERPISVGHLKDQDIVGFGGVKFRFRARVLKRS